MIHVDSRIYFNSHFYFYMIVKISKYLILVLILYPRIKFYIIEDEHNF